MLNFISINDCIICIGTICTLFVTLSSSSHEFRSLLGAPAGSVPATKRQATKGPSDETAGYEVYQRRNGWRRIVPATKWLATKCIRDETSATKRQRRNVLLRTKVNVR